jgi:glycerol-3-phosphate dehydrogenase
VSVPADFDIYVIGGGINGCGIARDAAGRGFSVALCEMNDLAGATSSASTKLIHGGLRYLEYYKFRLVREALAEREVIWRSAPHIVRPLRFILPHHEGLRPAWLLRLGLALYDRIGGRTRLPGTRSFDLSKDDAGKPLKPSYRRAFEYSDCTVDDSRLVVLNARDAADRGAVIKTRTRFRSASRRDGVWRIATEDTLTGEEETSTARFIVNAAGPWVDRVLATSVDGTAKNVRLVQGSHIVVRKMFDHDRCYLFQTSDKRVVFAIPYQQDYTLIGTTDLDHEGDPSDTEVTPREVSYLCDAVNRYFSQAVSEDDVVWAYSGVRALYDDGASAAQDATRDYVLRWDGEEGDAPILNVFGGKITTYRRLAEAAVKMIEEHLGPRQPPWTRTAPLPGGDFSIDGLDELVSMARSRTPFIEASQLRRMVDAYGTLVADVVGDAGSSEDMGEDFGRGLTAREVTYLMEREWAQTADDVLWRRSKLGLRMSPEQVHRLSEWMRNRTRVPVEGPDL